MHKAAQRNEVDKLAKGPVDERDKKQRTPLHWAVEAGSTDAVEWLLGHGASCDARDAAGDTPWTLAAKGGDERTLELLADRVSGEAALVKHLLNGADALGRTAVHWALRLDGPSTLQALLERVQDADARRRVLLAVTSEGSTPLHEGCMYGAEECVNVLLQALGTGRAEALAVLDKNGHAAVHVCAINHPTMLRLFRDSELDVRTRSGQTLLSVVEEFGAQVDDVLSAARLRAMAAAGADQLGRTAAHYAAMLGDADRVQYLTETLGVDASAKDAEGKTAADLLAAVEAEDASLAAVAGGGALPVQDDGETLPEALASKAAVGKTGGMRRRQIKRRPRREHDDEGLEVEEEEPEEPKQQPKVAILCTRHPLCSHIFL